MQILLQQSFYFKVSIIIIHSEFLFSFILHHPFFRLSRIDIVDIATLHLMFHLTINHPLKGKTYCNISYGFMKIYPQAIIMNAKLKLK